MSAIELAAGPPGTDTPGSRWRRRGLVWVRLLTGVAVLGVLLLQVGVGPFLDGVLAVDLTSVLAATAIAAVTTVAAAWRWRLVAGGLGAEVPLRTAVAAYYRSQFLNTVLPGGVLGDVERGVRHGSTAGLGRGLRSVAWERAAGQVVQLALTLVVLVWLPSPVTEAVPVAAAALALVAVGAALALRRATPAPATRRRRLREALRADLRSGLLAGRCWPGIVAASVLVVAGHTATFLLAARTAGATVPLVQLLPLALLVLLAMAVPANVGGWGPREGAAAWLFAAAGLGAGAGVSAATVYGVLACVATLPGAAVLVAAALSRTTTTSGTGDAAARQPVRPEPAAARGRRAGRG